MSYGKRGISGRGTAWRRPVVVRGCIRNNLTLRFFTMLIKCKSYFIAIGILIRSAFFLTRLRPRVLGLSTLDSPPPSFFFFFFPLALFVWRKKISVRQTIPYNNVYKRERPSFNFPFGLGVCDCGLRYFSRPFSAVRSPESTLA